MSDYNPYKVYEKELKLDTTPTAEYKICYKGKDLRGDSGFLLKVMTLLLKLYHYRVKTQSSCKIQAVENCMDRVRYELYYLATAGISFELGFTVCGDNAVRVLLDNLCNAAMKQYPETSKILDLVWQRENQKPIVYTAPYPLCKYPWEDDKKIKIPSVEERHEARKINCQKFGLRRPGCHEEEPFIIY